MISWGMLRPRTSPAAHVGADVRDTPLADDRKLWYFDPDSKVAAGTAPNGFKIFRATAVDSITISDDTKQIAAIKYIEYPAGAPSGYGRGDGEISEVLAGKGPKVGDYAQAAFPRQQTGKKSTRAATEASADGSMILLALTAVGAVFLMTR